MDKTVKTIRFQPKPPKRIVNRFEYDSDWDYYDDLTEANKKYWNSKPLSLGEEDFEEDLNADGNNYE